MSTVTQKIQDQVSSLYIAFFGRAPDAKGFGHWAEELAAGASPFKIAADFALSPEWTSNYGGLTPTQQVNRFYQNTFGRQADAAGLEYWVDEIEGGLPFSTVAYQIIWAAYLGGDTVDPADNALVLNKIAVAEYFAIELSSNDTAIAATAFVNVTQNPATVTEAEARLAVAVNPPETFTLTTGADYHAALAASAIFNGTVNLTGQLTWQTWDTIVGGSGIDTLNADMNGNVVTMTNVSSIENLNLNVFTSAATVNAAGLTSIQSITANDAVGLTINSLGSLPSVTLSGAGATALQFTAAALTPSAQTLNVTLAGKTGGALTISDLGTTVLETVAISSTGGANTIGGLTTSGIGSTTLTISGDQNLTLGGITDTNSTLRTVNASAATGNVTTGALIASSTFTGGSGNDSVTSSGGANNFAGGSGNDTFVMGANLTAVDTIAGGDGTADTITAAAATLAAFTAAAPTTNISGIESLTLTTVMAGQTLLLSAIQAGINDVNVSTAGAAQTGTITFDSGVAGNVDVVGTATAVATLGAFTVTSAGSGTADSITIDNDTVGSNIFAGAITATGVETLTLDGTTTTTAIAQGNGAIALAASTGGTTTLVLQGNNSFVPGAVITAGTINASALTMNLAGVQSFLTMTAGANTATTIIGSAGADTLLDNNAAATAVSIDGGAGNDIITSTGLQNDTLLGGTGDDTITGAQGNDFIDGGAGNDTVNVLTADITANDTIIGGDGTDILSYTTYTAATANVVASQARVSEFEILRIEGVTAAAQDNTLSNYINNAGFTTIRLGTSVAANGVDFENASSTLNTIQLAVTSASDTVGTHTFDRLVDTSADALTISQASSVGGVGVAATLTALSALDEETINISGTNSANDLTISTLTVADLTTLNITGAADVIITSLVGNANLATVNASAATGAVTVDASSAGRAVTMTANSSSTAVNTLTGGVFADVITGGRGADVLVGGGGADTISGGAGADNITGSAGADNLTGGTGVDNFNQALAGSSVAASAISLADTTGPALTIAVGDTITFGNGVDVITDFTAGAAGDTITGNSAGATLTTLIGEDALVLTATGEVFFASGTFTSSTGVFVISADGLGADTLIVYGAAGGASNDLSTNTNMQILLGVDSDNLAAGNFL